MALPKIDDETTSYNTSNTSTDSAKLIQDDTSLAIKYAKEMKSWKDDLKKYWTQMTKNEELYEFYKSEYTETGSNISLNTSFAIIESQIAKENSSAMQVTVKAEGDNRLHDFEEWVASAIKHMMTDQKVASIKGTFRKKRERFSRQLKVVGNAVAEVSYCYSTQVVNGKKAVVADNPYIINRHYKNLVFNPARQFDNSNIYYVIDTMSYEDMKNQEFASQKDKDGKEVTSGKFRNLDLLAKSIKKEGSKQNDDSEIKYVSGDIKIAKKNEAIEVITRWELKKAGWTRCVFANGKVMVMPETVDPLKIGGHNLLLAMRYVIEGRPYAYGEMDPIYKIARAQDTIVNQKIEIIEKGLRGSYIAGSSLDVDSLMLVLQQGGVMTGDGSDLHSVPVINPPQAAFLETNEMQQALERAARYSGYEDGATQSSTDKTKGTGRGIIALQTASQPNTQSQIDDIEEMFLEPYAYKGMKMKAQYMSPDETFFALIEGKNAEWIKISKGILAGTATLMDFITNGTISKENANSIIGTKDQEGNPITMDSVLFETSWLVSVSLKAQDANEKMQKLTQEQALIFDSVKNLGIQVDPDRTFMFFAEQQDNEELKTLLLTPQEKQAKQQQAQQAQQAQTQSEIAIKQAGQKTEAPSERVNISTNYKDAPPDVQRQIEALDGLTPSTMQPQIAATMKQPLPAHMQDVQQPAIANQGM